MRVTKYSNFHSIFFPFSSASIIIPSDWILTFRPIHLSASRNGEYRWRSHRHRGVQDTTLILLIWPVLGQTVTKPPIFPILTFLVLLSLLESEDCSSDMTPVLFLSLHKRHIDCYMHHFLLLLLPVIAAICMFLCKWTTTTRMLSHYLFTPFLKLVSDLLH